MVVDLGVPGVPGVPLVVDPGVPGVPGVALVVDPGVPGVSLVVFPDSVVKIYLIRYLLIFTNFINFLFFVVFLVLVFTEDIFDLSRNKIGK